MPMTFNEGGSFEGGRVRSRRGGAVAAGGGIGVLAIVALIVSQLTGVDLTGVVAGIDGGGTGQQQEQTIGECTVEQANTDPACRLSATIQSLDAYWVAQVADQGELPLPQVVEFSGSTASGCGQASSSTGPFYCPPDQTIYLDLGFYDLLQSRFGASGGPLAEMYVTAHEYGHHLQNMLGIMSTTERDAGAESGSVRLELQADCFAGMWAGAAATTIDPDRGVPFLEPIADAELADALSAAEAVGDDHIQAASGGGVNPHTWTHGSSEQRQRWFLTGYEQGTLTACDTFAATDL